MKGPKPPQKATIILCLSFSNKHQQMNVCKAVIRAKQPKKKFFLAYCNKKLNEYYG